MSKQQLLELVEWVEGLSGPCRETDAEIAIALFDGGADHLDDPRDVTRARKVLVSHGATSGDFEVVGFSGIGLRSAPSFTASLDAAMTLVPEGWCFEIYRWISGEGEALVCQYNPGDPPDGGGR